MTPTMPFTPPPPKPSRDLAEAAHRLHSAAQSLEIVSALGMNPIDPNQLNAGIDVALRRLEGDLAHD